MFSILQFNFTRVSKTCLSYIEITLDHVSANGLDGDDFKCILMPSSEHFSELTITYFILQHVFVNYFRHIQINPYIFITLKMMLVLMSMVMIINSQSLVCDVGLYPNLNLGVCILCSTGCLSCCDQNLCMECDTGYVLSTTSGLCIPCPPNCDSCDQALICLACGSSTTLQAGICLSCPIGCSICSDSSTCTTCQSQYYLVSNGCQPCPLGCSACSFSTGYTCTSCADTFYLNSPNCIACSLPCINCNGATSCLTCQQDFYLSGNTCNSCPLSCSTCTSLILCTACASTFYLNSGSCLPCVANCDICIDGTSCQTCLTNYSLTVSQTCFPCLIPCATCQANGTCLTCLIGYYFDNGQCITCIAHCTSCIAAYLCSNCSIGYFFDGTSCVSCGIYCRECSQLTGKCTKCLQGFQVIDGDCVECSGAVCSCQLGSSYYSLYSLSSQRIIYILPLIMKIVSHVMTNLRSALLFAMILLTVSTYWSQQLDDDQKIIELQQQLQALHPDFIQHFLEFYHIDEVNQHKFLNASRVEAGNGAYLLFVAKMYLYNILPSTDDSRLSPYNTESSYLAAYIYLKFAATQKENAQAYYLLGILQTYKLVPDHLIAHKLEGQTNRSKPQQILMKQLNNSHLFNAESNLFMSSILGFDPASLVLGFMNKNRFGTNRSCSAALAYYLSVVQNTYIETFLYRQIYSLHDSLQEDLYTKRKILPLGQIYQHSFIENTDYFDEETISATIELADNYYMGRRGYIRNVTRAARLYERLAAEGVASGKVMAGLLYFKGEGVQQDYKKAYMYFSETASDQISEMMLVAIKYFELIQKGTKESALNTLLVKYKGISKNKEKLSPQMNFLIGSAILKGELKGVPTDEGFLMLDKAAAQGNTFSKILLGILFADGSAGLKYGCDQAIKYFSEQAIVFPFFKNRASMGQVAVKNGRLSFALIKYMQLSMIGYENAFVNMLYLFEVYQHHSLNMVGNSWSIQSFKNNMVYRQLKDLGLWDVEHFMLKQYSVQNLKFLNYNNLEQYFQGSTNSTESYLQYMRKKVITRGTFFEKKNIMKYYEYKLAKEEGGDVLPILTSLAAGDGSKLYVSEARYLLGKHHHKQALRKEPVLSTHSHFKILGEYNRAIKSQLLGNIIFQIEQYLLAGAIDFDFFESQVGEDLLAYIFVVSICIFVLYYLRSKRIDQFHKAELEKQQRKMHEEMEQRKAEEEQERMKNEAEMAQSESKIKIVEGYDKEEKKENIELDPNQPIIIEEEFKGVRIGSSLDQDDYR